MTAKVKSDSQDLFKKLLRKAGLKATPARLTILAIFRTTKRPLAAQEVIDALPSSGKNKVNNAADQATIYRTFQSLKTKGIIRQVDLRHNHAHYELVDNDSHHHHLICIQCGKIEDVSHAHSGVLEAAVLRDSKHFANIQEHALEFYGVCKSCARVEIERTPR